MLLEILKCIRRSTQSIAHDANEIKHEPGRIGQVGLLVVLRTELKMRLVIECLLLRYVCRVYDTNIR